MYLYIDADVREVPVPSFRPPNPRGGTFMNHRCPRSSFLPAAFVLLVCGTVGAVAFQQTGSGMIGYWKFDETSGTVAADSSGNSNTMNYTGGPTQSATVPTLTYANPRSLSFNGTSSYVSIATLNGLTPGNTAHTTAAWIKVNALPATRAWILLLGNEGAGSEHWLIDSAGVTQFGVWGGTQVAPVLGTAWHHVALTFDGTTLKGYLDGNPMGAGAAATYNLMGVPLSIAQNHNGENYFNGLVDDVRVYGRALTATEVSGLAAGKAGPDAPVTLTATAGNGQVTLDWTASAGPGTVVYNLKRSTTSGGSPAGTYTTIAPMFSGTSYVDSPLTNGTTYYYVVSAVSFGEGPNSTQASATPVVPAPRLTADGDGMCGVGSAGAPSAGAFAILVLILAGVLAARR